MTQQLTSETIGSQKGYENNFQADLQKGLVLADNITFSKPLQGFSKRKGQKSLMPSEQNEIRKGLYSTDDGVISVRETSILGYKKDGTPVTLYSLSNSDKILLRFSTAVSIQKKLRLDFDESLWDAYLPFLELAFPEKMLSPFEGFFEPLKSITTIAIEQDSVDTDLLRLSSVINFPISTNSFELSNFSGLSVSPSVGNFDVINRNDVYIEVYPNGGTPPVWTSTGDTGFVDLTLLDNDFYISALDQASSSESLANTFVSAFFDSEGLVPTNFDTSEQKKIIFDETGDETFFNSSLGQTYFSDENLEYPQVSLYGVPKGIDAVPFIFDLFGNIPSSGTKNFKGCLGPLEKGKMYAYCAVFKKVLNEQTFLGKPSPFFYNRVNTNGFYSLSSPNIGLLFDDLVIKRSSLSLGSTDDFEIFGLQFKNVVSTPSIPDNTVFKVTRSTSVSLFISPAEQIRVLGSILSSITSADVAVCPAGVISCAIPHHLFEDYNNENNRYKYYVQIYRSVGVSTGSPDISQMFLVKEEEFPPAPLQIPHILAIDGQNAPLDFELESNLPLYINTSEEGPLQSNDTSPRYQAQITKNGTNFLGNLEKNKQVVSNVVFKPFFTGPSGNVVLETGESEIWSESFFTTLNDKYEFSQIEISRNTIDFTKADLDWNISFVGNYLLKSGYGKNNSYFFWCCRLDTQESFIARIGNLISGTTYEFLRIDGVSFNLPATGTVKCLAGPLCNGLSICQLTSTYPSSVFTSFLSQYCLNYRSINLNSYNTPEILSSNFPSITKFYQKSRFNLYFQGIPQYAFNEETETKLSLTFERKTFDDYSGTIPPFRNIIDTIGPFNFENFPFHIAYSKPLEPTAFPPLNFLTVGTTKNQIHSLFKIRDSIIICSSEGFYRLTGDFSDDFAITLIDDDYVSLSPLLNQELNETVYSFSDRGFVAISESNIVKIDYGIQNLVSPILNLNLDFSSLNSDQVYSSVKKEDDEVIWFFPNINEDRTLTSTSEIGLVFHTLSQNWSTINRTKSGSELIWISNNEDYSVISSEKSDLNLQRKNLDRSDFCMKEIKSALRQEISTTSSIIENTSVLNIFFNFNHELQIGDLITIESFAPLSFFGSGVTESNFLGVFPISILDEKNISINLSVTPLITLTGLITLKFGARGLKGTLSLSSGSSVGSIVFSRLSDDTNWSIGDKIYVNTPWQANLISSLANESDLLSLREITGLSPLTFNLSSNAIANFSEEIEFSKETRQPLTQSFQAPTNTFLEDDFAFLEKPNKVLYPFSFEKRQSDNLIQGFLERPFDPQKKLIRPSLVYTGLKSSVLTSKITGGNPAVLKAFEEVIMIPQNQWSSSYVTIAFQSDRFFSTQKTEMKSQTDLLSPFSPTFGEIIWSSLFSQWQDFTAIKGTFDLYQISPTVIMRLNVPIDVTQSTWLAIYLLHERPFETFAMGTISTTGTFLTPIGVG